MRAARLLGVHYRTIIVWCQQRMEGGESRITKVTRTVSGRYYLDAEEIHRLREQSLHKTG